MLAPANRFDLHMHSTRSDGRFEPAEVLDRAVRGGLEVIAVTDHDLVSPLAPGPHTHGERTVHVLAGAEVTGVHEGVELHLLVYFAGDVPGGFRDFCEHQARLRSARYELAIENLGFADLPPPDAAARSGHRSVTRLHLAHALVERGHARNTRDAFTRYLGDRTRVPPIDAPFVDVIRVARGFGGVTSWAHPPLARLRKHLAAFVAAGLQGVEALRPYLPRDDVRALRKEAARHGAFVTGGSDWHGWHDPDDLGLFCVERRDLGGFLAALAA